MTELDRSVRLRALLDAWFPVFVIVLVLLAAGVGYWTYQVHAVPEVEQQQHTVEEWSESTSFEHSALIVNDTLPFEEGERAENRPIYYTRISDNLDVTYTYEYTAQEGDLSVSTDTRLRFRAIQDEDVFWEVTEPLATESTESMGPEDNHSVSFSVNIDHVMETIGTVQEQLGTQGTVEITIISVTTVDGTVEGDEVEHSYESSMPITVNPDTFRVLETNTVDEQHETVETVEIPVEPSPFERIGSILMLLFSVGLIGALGAGRYGGYIALDEDEQELLKIHQQEQEFSEWITSGTFPSERDYESTILVDDLEGLVDVAIDTNKRVIKDEQLGVSTVLDGEYVYIYVRPDSPASDWLMNYADTTLDDMNQFEF